MFCFGKGIVVYSTLDDLVFRKGHSKPSPAEIKKSEIANQTKKKNHSQFMAQAEWYEKRKTPT